MKRSSRNRTRRKNGARPAEAPGTGTAGTGMSREQEKANPGKGMPFTNLMLIPGSLVPLTMSMWTSSMQIMQSGARSLTDLSLEAMRSWVGVMESSSELISTLVPKHA